MNHLTLLKSQKKFHVLPASAALNTLWFSYKAKWNLTLKLCAAGWNYGTVRPFRAYTCSLCCLLTRLLIHPGTPHQRQRIHFSVTSKIGCQQCQPVQTRGLTAVQFGCPGQLGNCSCRAPAHIHIVPSLRSPMSLNVAWHACGCAYQITPHSTPNMLHISSIIRHVFLHPAPTCTYINIHSVTAGNWEGWTLLYNEADSRRHICIPRGGEVICVSWQL